MKKDHTKSSCKNNSRSSDRSMIQHPSRYQTSYGQIRYLMKRLSTALSNKLKEGRPAKFCRLCSSEIRSMLHEKLQDSHTIPEGRKNRSNQKNKKRVKRICTARRQLITTPQKTTKVPEVKTEEKCGTVTNQRMT